MKVDFPHSALIIVDIQNDFCPGGALGVENGDSVIDPLNNLASLFADRYGRVVATQDWHTADHASFATSHEGKKPGETVDLPKVKSQILWPPHCVQGSFGAEFHERLDQRPVSFIIRKGFRNDLDSYSAFFENDRKTHTGLDGFLKALSICTILVGGLATDYCVFYSAMDAVSLGYNTYVIGDAVKGVNFPEGSISRALKFLDKAGVIVVASEDID